MYTFFSEKLVVTIININWCSTGNEKICILVSTLSPTSLWLQVSHSTFLVLSVFIYKRMSKWRHLPLLNTYDYMSKIRLGTLFTLAHWLVLATYKVNMINPILYINKLSPWNVAVSEFKPRYAAAQMVHCLPTDPPWYLLRKCKVLANEL